VQEWQLFHYHDKNGRVLIETFGCERKDTTLSLASQPRQEQRYLLENGSILSGEHSG
jgi:hypothetical protein